jgi:hypothetical protein
MDYEQEQKLRQFIAVHCNKLKEILDRALDGCQELKLECESLRSQGVNVSLEQYVDIRLAVPDDFEPLVTTEFDKMTPEEIDKMVEEDFKKHFGTQ